MFKGHLIPGSESENLSPKPLCFQRRKTRGHCVRGLSESHRLEGAGVSEVHRKQMVPRRSGNVQYCRNGMCLRGLPHSDGMHQLLPPLSHCLKGSLIQQQTKAEKEISRE